MAKKFRSESPEVFYPEDDAMLALGRADIDWCKTQSSRNTRKRARMCAHGSPDDSLHEMLIVHERGAYIRPHRHPGKIESIHIVEGEVDVVVFKEDGRIASVIRMGDYPSGKDFYHRISRPVFHTLLIRSAVLVFHETTNGPFSRGDTVFAPWAPEEGEHEAARVFLANLDSLIGLAP